jgi:ribose transport system permease protein
MRTDAQSGELGNVHQQEVGSPPLADEHGLSTVVIREFKRWAVIGLFAVMIALFSIAKPDVFPTWQNAKDILDQTPITAMFAVAVTLAMLMGEFDISFPYVADLVSAFVAFMMTVAIWTSTIGIVATVLLAFVVAGIFGLLNGVLIARIRVPAFVTTLATGSIAAGLELMFQNLYPNGQQAISSISLPSVFPRVGDSVVPGIGVNWTVVVAFVLCAVIWFVLRKTVSGRRVHAIGGNARAAVLAGVPVTRIRIWIFIVVALIAALGGLITVSQVGFFNGTNAALLLPSYTATFLGASVWGLRRFNVGGTVLAVLFLETMANGLSIMNQPLWIVSVVSGVVLLVAVVMGRTREA